MPDYLHLSTMAWALMAVALCLPTAVHANDEITLSSGLVIVGEVISTDGADPVRIRVQEGSIKALLTYPADEVVAIAYGANQRAAKIAALRKELTLYTTIPLANREQWFDTILNFEDMGETTEFKFALQVFIDFFPNHAPARQALGYELYEGKWLTAAEIKQAQGLNYYDGAWRSAAEIDALKEADALARAEKQKDRDLRKARRDLIQQAARIAAANNAATYYPAHPLDRDGSYQYYRHYSTYYYAPRTWPGNPHHSNPYGYYSAPRSRYLFGYGGSSHFHFRFNVSFP